MDLTKNLFELFFSNNKNIVYIKDKEYKFTSVNEAFKDKFSLTESDIIGKRVFDLFSNDTAKLIYENDKKIFSKGISLNVEEYITIEDRTYYLIVNKVPLINNKEIIDIANIGIDITNKKILDEKIKYQNNRRSKIFSIMAHDLRNLFNSILGSSELLKSNYDVYSYEEKKTIMATLYDSTRKAVDLFENLLVWSMSHWREEYFVIENYQLNSIIEESISPLLISANEKNIRIQNLINKNISVKSDINKLKTVIRNIVNNSIKFTPPQGSIKIEAESTEYLVKVTISDNGIGMSDELIKSLFNLEQFDSKIKSVYKNGVGLGLLICKDFIEQNGGQLWAEQKDGLGSKFHFTIPKEQIHGF